MSGRLFGPILATLNQSLNLRMQQHGLSTSNIANAETPGYHARRLDFEAAFERILGASSDGEELTASDLEGSVDEIAPPAWSEDGNSVNPDEEMSVLVTNNMLFNATVEVMNRRLAMLKYAATDGGKG